MNLRDRARRSLILVAALSVIFASGAFADNHVDDEELDVSVMAIHGERGLEVSAITGGSLSSLSLQRVGATAPFVTTVTDTLYDHIGYQVTANLSNLYLDGDVCETSIASDNLQLGFVNPAAGIDDVFAEIVPEMEFDRAVPDTSITISGITIPNLQTLLGDADEITIVVDGVVDTVTDLADNLPVSVENGAGGEFVNPAPHDDCDPSPTASPTEVVIQSGDQRDFSLSVLADAVFDTVTTADDAVPGLITEDALVAALTSEVEDLLIDTSILLTGISTGTIVDAIVEELRIPLTAFVESGDSVIELLGQSGVYTAVPRLELNGTGGAPTGEYTGTMTVTLLDDDHS